MSTGGILRRLRLDRTTDAGTLKGSWDERRYDDLAELATKSVVVSTQMPPLHLGQIQTGRVAFVRRSSQLVRASPGALYVLLATILLVLSARRGMSVLYYDSGPTSNDLLHRLMANHSLSEPRYQIVAQSAEEVQNVENAPAVSMGPYLSDSGQSRLLTNISIYSLRGDSREQVRLLYMNATAIRVWEEMGKAPQIIGTQARPPRSASLTYGVPFSQ